MRSASVANRPRLWVPGVLYVSDEGELSAGDHVGFNGRGPDFARSRCGHAATLAEWRHRAWLVKRSELDDDIVEQHAIILPETLLDPDEQPHARRWLELQPLLCVSGTKVERLLGAGLRVYTVEHGVEGEGVLGVSAEGGERASWSLRAPLRELLPEAFRPIGDEGLRLFQSERLEVRSFVDRLLDGLSRGVLREASVVNALAVRELIEPGYGYRGATFGAAAPVEKVAHGLRALDALFAQIFERAREQRGDAKEIARAVMRASGDDENLVELPIYGSARRVLLDEVHLPLPEGAYLRSGEPEPELVLPGEARWFVDRVSMWRPKLSPELDKELEREVVEPAAPRPWIVLGLTAVLVAIIAAGFVATRLP